MSTYSSVEIGLIQQSNVVKKISTPHKNASKEIIPLISALLAEYKMHLQDLAYIALNQGPGPFTTLRTVIASANGLAFATQIPLIGIDVLHTLVKEYSNPLCPTVGLLNAFSNDVYYAVQENNVIKQSGYQEINTLLQTLNNLYTDEKILFIGGAALLYQKEIMKVFAERAIMPENMPIHCSLEKLAEVAYENWQNKRGIQKEVLPLYLKTHSAILGS